MNFEENINSLLSSVDSSQWVIVREKKENNPKSLWSPASDVGIIYHPLPDSSWHRRYIFSMLALKSKLQVGFS